MFKCVFPLVCGIGKGICCKDCNKECNARCELTPQECTFSAKEEK